jgi:hypothetical protein
VGSKGRYKVEPEFGQAPCFRPRVIGILVGKELRWFGSRKRVPPTMGPETWFL